MFGRESELPLESVDDLKEGDMSQRSNRKQKEQAELRKKGINPKGYGNWNKTIPEGYTFNFPKKKATTPQEGL